MCVCVCAALSAVCVSVTECECACVCACVTLVCALCAVPSCTANLRAVLESMLLSQEYASVYD